MIITEIQKEDGWTKVTEGIVSSESLVNVIHRYFGVNEDLSFFQRRNGIEGLGLELRTEDGQRGYVFVGSIQLNRDIKSRMEHSASVYEISRRVITSEFVDYERELAGFSWRAK